MFICLSRSLTQPVAHSLTHAHVHAYAYYIFQLVSTADSVTMQTHLHETKTSMDHVIKFLTTFQPSSYSMRTIYYCSLFVIMIVAVTKKTTTQEIIHQFKQNHSETLIHANI